MRQNWQHKFITAVHTSSYILMPYNNILYFFLNTDIFKSLVIITICGHV